MMQPVGQQCASQVCAHRVIGWQVRLGAAGNVLASLGVGRRACVRLLEGSEIKVFDRLMGLACEYQVLRRVGRVHGTRPRKM